MCYNRRATLNTGAAPLTIPPWLLLAAAVPVLLLGERLVRRVRPLWRMSIPAPVVGGLLAAAAVTGLRLAGVPVAVDKATDSTWWLWVVRPVTQTKPDVYLPLAVAFFTCVGLTATAGVVRAGGRPLLMLLAAATGLAALQNAVGVPLARALGQPAALGLACGSVTL
ncbi:MAG: hypothetical protein JWO31_1154, partial [Phycisphaerales bacterium]|nr:hypothetical protein [Phycisphaerales bacterium]